MSIGMTLLLVALLMHGALVYEGEHAPRFLWRLLWLPVCLAGVLLVWFSFWITGRQWEGL